MKHPHDNIRVGAITFVYSVTKRGWVFPGLSVIRNPLKAQRLAEEINNKRGAVCTKHLLLSYSFSRWSNNSRYLCVESLERQTRIHQFC